VKEPVAVIGLGNMGFPMARNLLAAGFPLAVHNRTRAKAEPLDAGGAAVAASAAEAAERARIVITMLADDQAIETLAEAFALVEKAGLDRLAVLETLNGALSRTSGWSSARPTSSASRCRWPVWRMTISCPPRPVGAAVSTGRRFRRWCAKRPASRRHGGPPRQTQST